MTYFFWQCRDDACRFRFPATEAEATGRACPRCRGPFDQVAATTKTYFAPAAAPARAVVALLDNIRSIHNTGSMFRTADGAGLGHLHLAGMTATPQHPRLAKAALGAHETVPWTYHPNGVDAAAQLKADGYYLLALERTEPGSAQPSLLAAGAPPGPTALVVGNERAGVDPGILALCDAVVSLPMTGRKSSLNVAVAFGIAVYALAFVLQPPSMSLIGSER